MSTYFTLPSFARAKKNKEDLEKTNPQQPILRDEDEHFLERLTSGDDTKEPDKDVQREQISDEGRVLMAPERADDKRGLPQDQLVLPETRPEQQEREMKGQPEGSSEAGDTPSKPAKRKSFELPSQEEAEAATRGFPRDDDQQQPSQTVPQNGGEKTWASYLPSFSARSTPNKAATDNDSSADTTQDKQSWKEYASSYVPAKSSIPSLPNFASLGRNKDKDAEASPVYNEDGTIDEGATKEKQEQEVSVLLDNLNASLINNRVFSLSGPMQSYYERFTQCLKDTINGAPTAYDDMDKLMREAGPQLQKLFEGMPPFVQTLVKSLPAKLTTTLGPELMAATSEKPGTDAQARMAGASKNGSGAGLGIDATTDSANGAKKKQKRKIPGMKKLFSKGTVTTALSNIVNFIKIRFPFLASATNVLMSLAVFILMLVFWYCHKRGREERLTKEAEQAEQAKNGTVLPDDSDTTDDEETSEGGPGNDSEQQQIAAESLGETTVNLKDSSKDVTLKQDSLKQPDPNQVPLPKEEDEKGKPVDSEI